MWGSGGGTADPRCRRTSPSRGASQRERDRTSSTQGAPIPEPESCLRKPLLLFVLTQPRQLQADPTTLRSASIKTTPPKRTPIIAVRIGKGWFEETGWERALGSRRNIGNDHLPRIGGCEEQDRLSRGSQH